MAKLSVVITAFNEEKNIGDCLESVKWADEIIVVDNSSQDKTREIAKKYTKKIHLRPNYPMLNINKNFGFEKAVGDWILSLDSDERVEPELREEMQAILKNPPEKPNGFKIPRKNIIFGKWIEHTGWYPDYQLRFFKKDKGKFAAKHVHEQLTLSGETGVLKGNLLHLNYTSVAQFFYKMHQIYAPNQAQNIWESGKEVVWQDAISWPIQEFFRRYFVFEGWKDGFHGLVLSLLQALDHLVIFALVWEKQGFWEVKEKDFFQNANKEFVKTGKDFRWWLVTTQIARQKNILGKLILKLKRKFF